MKTKTLCLLALLVFALCSCGSTEAGKTSEVEKYKCMKADTSMARIVIDFASTIESVDVVDVYSMVTGYVTKKVAKDGQYVNKGDVILQLDTRELQASYDAAVSRIAAAKANLAAAKLEIIKLTPLVEKGIISELELKTAEAQYDSYNAELEASESSAQVSKVNLGYTTIKAPRSGFIGKINYHVGELVTAGGGIAITRLASAGKVEAKFTIPEKTILTMREYRLANGKAEKTGKNFDEDMLKYINDNFEIRLVLSNGKMFEKHGIVDTESNIVESGTGTIKHKAIFEDEDDMIFSGSSGRVRFIYSEHGVITVPKSACYELQDKMLLYVVNPDDNSVHACNVEVESAEDNMYVVYDGLKQGDIVLLEGLTHVQEGEKIEPIFE